MPMRGEKRGTRIRPESTTTRMPSIVSDVSAIALESTTFRAPGGAGASDDRVFFANQNHYQVFVKAAVSWLPTW